MSPCSTDTSRISRRANRSSQATETSSRPSIAAFSIQANALRIVAVLVCVVVLLVVAELLAFLSATHADDYERFGMLGMTRSQLRAFELLRSLLVAGIATLVSVATAIALSPLSPIGIARQIEPSRGVDVNAAYIPRSVDWRSSRKSSRPSALPQPC